MQTCNALKTNSLCIILLSILLALSVIGILATLGQKSLLFFKSTHQISNFSPAEFFIVLEGGCLVPVVTLTPWFYFSVSDNPSIPSATSLFVHLHFFSKESNIPLCSFMQGIYKKIKKYTRKMIKNYSL